MVSMEFNSPSHGPFKGRDCFALRGEFDETVSSLVRGQTSVRRRARLAGTLKSLRRLFDVECSRCDKVARSRALRQWQDLMSRSPGPVEADWCYDPIWLLRRRVRELTFGWGRRLAAAREDLEGDPGSPLGYIPDQQGCLEEVKARGGTMAVSESEYSVEDSQVRVGTAKQKGKLRVVTMQSARVKRVLTPVHKAAYDHISSFDWCVRGDVDEESFSKVAADKKNGERFVSADYRAATDNLNPAAVKAVVEELSSSPELTEEERGVLLGSFSNIWWESRSGKKHAILRGSMMGNLGSFVVLCILNKACFDIACDIEFGSGSHRIGRFNGDDCCFSGTTSFFSLWKKVVATYGFIVNEEKTGISDRFIELNSRTYDSLRGQLIPIHTLSFFRPQLRRQPGEILSEVLASIEGLSMAVQLWVLNDLFRHEIVAHGVEPNAIPTRWLRRLLRRSWFRSALEAPAPYVRTVGVDRSVPTVVGPPPRAEYVSLVEAACNAVERAHTRRWRGVKTIRLTARTEGECGCRKTPCLCLCRCSPRDGTCLHYSAFPLSSVLVRKFSRANDLKPPPTHPRRWELRFEWSYVWPKHVLDYVERVCPQILVPAKERSQRALPYDSPRASVRTLLVFGRYRRGRVPPRLSRVPPPPSLLVGVRQRVSLGDGLLDAAKTCLCL